MLTETLENELSSYRIGQKLRGLRTRKGLRLKELADHTSLSTAMLSKIETGKMVPTLPTLTRIALVFDIGLEYFFSDAETRKAVSIVRQGDRLRLHQVPGEPESSAYDFESLDFPAVERKLTGFLAEFRDTEDPPQHEHRAPELIYIFEGKIKLTVEESDYVLHAGDAAYIEPFVPHTYRREGKQTAKGIVVTLPSTR